MIAAPDLEFTGEARDRAAGATVTVGLGGRLRTLELTPRSMRLGGDALARVILALVRTATAQVNQKARLAWPTVDLDALGLPADTALTDTIEETTPDTWMR